MLRKSVPTQLSARNKKVNLNDEIDRLCLLMINLTENMLNKNSDTGSFVTYLSQNLTFLPDMDSST